MHGTVANPGGPLQSPLSVSPQRAGAWAEDGRLLIKLSYPQDTKSAVTCNVWEILGKNVSISVGLYLYPIFLKCSDDTMDYQSIGRKFSQILFE